MTNNNYMGFTFDEIMEMDELATNVFKKHKLAINVSLKDRCVNIKNLERYENKLTELDREFIKAYFEILYGSETKINVIN